MRRQLLIFALWLPAAAMAETMPVDQWLIRQQAATVPVFGDPADAAARLDATDDDSRERPAAGAAWSAMRGDARFTATNGATIVHAATYVVAPRWQKPKLTVTSDAPVRVFLNGEPLGDAVERKDGQYSFTKTVTLPRGKHLLRIKAAAHGECVIKAVFESEAAELSFTTDAVYSMADYESFTLFDDVGGMAISPNGKYLAYVRSTYNGTTKKESWLEVRDLAANRIVYALRPAKGIGNLGFLPAKTSTLYYTLSGEDGADIWILDTNAPRPRRIKKNVKGLVKLAGGEPPRLYLTIDGDEKTGDDDWRLFDELEDRMEDWTRRRTLHELNSETGEMRALTAAADSFALDAFAAGPGGKHILFTRRIPKTGRPYYSTEFWLYETANGTARKISEQLIAFETRPLSFTWLNDTHVAYVSAAYLTDEANPTEPNVTQTAVWRLDTRTGEVKNLTAGSVYSIEEDEGRGALRWNAAERRLWMYIVRGGETQILRLDPFAATPIAERVALSKPFVKEFDVAASGQAAMILAGPTQPSTLIAFDAAAKKERLLLDPNAELLPRVELATVEPWSFENADGVPIEGWLYKPADFTTEKQWPLIVYFYGGVSPRDLRWRHTYHWLCANGYVVYVLNPVGAIGYGPEFADKHSNDWGTLAARDVMEGTRKLLAEKRYLNPRKVGAYGGSYGGFLTMDLATKTDLFAALASLSGISNIASYFGGGTWGFTYGDIALPGSYPWNRKDVFVDKSPLFNADKVTTPLLLMHGEADVNVPALESDQMFVALKLLGKNVAYVKFKGEDHIFTKHKNRVAEFELMREWFDYHLKDEPDAWEARW